MVSLQGKAALITGGGSGIGAATARKLAGYGAQVGLIDRDDTDSKQVVKEIEDAGGKGIALKADVSDARGLQQAIDHFAREAGRIDIVFANAGINGVWAPLDVLTPEDWDETLGINLKGTFLTVKYALPHLQKAGGGSIVITSSINGTRTFSNTGASAYSSSKAGQVAFAKMIAIELAPQKIRVNVVCPGAIETNIDSNTEKKDVERVKIPVEFPEGNIPLTHGESGNAAQVADLVAFLSSSEASHITGTEVWIDGGQSLLV